MKAYKQIQEMNNDGTLDEYRDAFLKYCQETNQSVDDGNASLLSVPPHVANAILSLHMS